MEQPVSVWQGSFKLFGVEIKCHVLNDGKRIIEADSLVKLFEAMGQPQIATLDEDELRRFAQWQAGR